MQLLDATIQILYSDKVNRDKKALKSIISSPPSIDKGDVAFPMFLLAKVCKQSPQNIANEVVCFLSQYTISSQSTDMNEATIMPNMVDSDKNRSTVQQLAFFIRSAEALGPYVNLFFNRVSIAPLVLQDMTTQDKKNVSNLRITRSTALVDACKEFLALGPLAHLQGKRIMIEFSAPNTNKPLHIGHLRNDVLGESISRILEYAGANVHRVNLINDRGAHICKSMLSYQMFGNTNTPKSQGKKSDHFVGDYYVQYDEWAKQNTQEAEQSIANI